MDRRVTTLGIAILLILAPLAGGANVAASTEGGTNAELENVYDTPHDNVSVWDGSIFTLRADTDTAAYTIPEPTLQVSPPDNTGPHPFDYEFGVFNVSEPISLNFEGRNHASTSELDGREATVIIAQMEPSAGLADFEPSGSFGEAELEALNENMSIKNVSEEEFGDEGNLSTEYTPTESGQYVAIVAIGDDDSSLVNNDNEFDPQGDSTIVGLDGFAVQNDASGVDAPSEIEPGENAIFDVETGLDGENIRHGIVLYDEQTVTESAAVLNVTAEPDSEFTADDIAIQHEILGLNGVLTVDGEEQITGSMTVDNLLEELNESVADNVPNKATGDVYLDGSVVINQTGDSNAKLTVETFGNWSEGDYRWIHVATSDNGEFESSTDTLKVKADDGNGGSPGFPSPSPPEEPDYRLSDASLSDAKIAPGDSVEISAKLQNVGEGTGPFTAELVIDGEVVDDKFVRVAPGQKDTVTFTHTFDEAGEYEVAINDANAGTVTVGEKTTSFEVTNAELSATEIDLDETVDVSATVTNTGEETGTFTAELLVDGEVVDEEDVRLFGGDETTVEFSQAFDETGEYEIAINDADAGTLTVTDSDDDDDDSIPGFGGLAALAALVSALLGLRYVPTRD